MGDWGCGKTSIINLTFNELKKDKPNWIFVEFNPWYFSNQENLILQFFKLLLDKLNSKHKINKSIKKSLKNLAKSLTISLNLKIITISSNIDKFLDNNKFKEVTSLKEELNESFSKLDYKIIISIDNIDRLTDDEIKQTFLLVKSLADFPNVIYILSFDRNVVVDSLQKLQNYDADKYLEKIIQVPIFVPEITQTRMNLLIRNKFSPIYQEFNGNEFTVKSEFNEIYRIILPFLKIFVI